ncbi:MlaE family ABC transporter permease [Dokdonella sp.]|uniref:MlaE family ABC transporter permease n=1 Tax=Dokdonella sp. TaxID=2291710 RepID=UPI0031BC5DA4|nr:ABC transporter permease [Dokdonella sp.]
MSTNPASASAATLRRDDAAGTLVATGDWTLPNVRGLAQRAAALRAAHSATDRVDAAGIERLDTAGAQILFDLAGSDAIDGLDPAQLALFKAVSHATTESERTPAARPDVGVLALLARTGAAVDQIGRDAWQLLGFIGLILATIARTLFQPWRWRITSFVFHVEQTGLDAVPIVVLLNFLVGAVVAFLGATVLKDFGASIYTVELVSYSFLREFAVLLTAIMVAGRSGSAFTAQIGSMKAREEIDAIRTLGLDPVVVLVLPRVLALLIALPILTVLAMLAGIVGGAMVCVLSLDVSATMFITRFQALGATQHFWVGMSKAPLFAFLIGAIGCLEGFKVTGSAESVGTHTTSSVVQAIFVTILVDALAAIFYMEIGL